MNQTAAPSRPVSGWLLALVPAALLSLHFALLVTSISRKAATVDEFVHVPSGCYYWKTGDFTLSGLNPPLANLWATAAVLPMHPWLPIAAPAAERTDADPWIFGGLFLAKNGYAYDAIITRARLSVMVLSVLAGVVLYLWAMRTYGFAAAALALGLYAVEPNVIAHGRLATQDTAMMLAFLLTLFLLDGLLTRGGWWRAALAGVALGAACLVKYSGLLIAPAIPVAFAACIVFLKGFHFRLRVPGEKWFTQGLAPWRRFAVGACPGVAGDSPPKSETGGQSLWQALVVLLSIAVVALLVINAVYSFSGGFRRLDPGTLKSRAMTGLADGPLGFLPVPLPRVYVEGLDGQQYTVEHGETINYLNMHWADTGWWYYYLEAFVLKVPIPTLLLILLGAASVFLVRRERRPAAPVMLAAGLIYWAMHSFGSNKEIGLRYMLPLFPLLLVLAGRSVLLIERFVGRMRVGLAVLLALLFAWAGAEACLIHPHYLAYFNEIAGGPRGGPRYLLDSNIDWGQDLPGLADYLKKEGIGAPVYLGYFGHVDPGLYGIKHRVPQKHVAGTVAVSVNYLYGMRYGGYPAGYFTWLLEHKPVAVIGHTIYVYRTDQQ